MVITWSEMIYGRSSYNSKCFENPLKPCMNVEFQSICLPLHVLALGMNWTHTGFISAVSGRLVLVSGLFFIHSFANSFSNSTLFISLPFISPGCWNNVLTGIYTCCCFDDQTRTLSWPNCPSSSTTFSVVLQNSLKELSTITVSFLSSCSSETHCSCFTHTIPKKLYLPRSKVTSVIQIQRSAEAVYLAHQLGLTLLTALPSTLHLAFRILSFLGFPPTSPAAPCLFTWFVLFSQFFLAVGVPLGLVVGPLLCFYSPHSWRSHPVSWPEKYHLKG